MKVRIKFTKEGPMKFVGHLDTMRYFQKAIRRAELPIAFSGGYSPHMIMSFAAPLGVGVTSTGEYFDMELTATIPTDEICQRLNSQMVDGIHVLSAVMDAFTSWLGQELPEFACMIHRLEVYADLGNEKKHKFVSLESLGVEVQ